jgi:aquaporin Z
MHLHNRLFAEFFGTLWLVLGGVGSAKLAAAFPDVGIGLLGVSLAFGLTVLTMAYAVGHISGGHFNPAISIGLWFGGRFSFAELIPYIIAQVAGACAAAAILALILANGPDGAAAIGNLASNGYGEASPGKFNLIAVIVTEVVMTAAFLMVIMGVTDTGDSSVGGTIKGRAPAGFAPLAIGLCLTLIHLISIPVSNTSVNPARSTGPALISMDATALSQLWVFWAAPIAGAIIGALAYRALMGAKQDA